MLQRDCGLVLSRGQTFTNRIPGQPGHAVGVEFGHEVLAVRADGFEAEMQVGSDRFGVMAFGDELREISRSRAVNCVKTEGGRSERNAS